MRVAVQEGPLAFRRGCIAQDPSVSRVTREDVKVEMEDSLEGDFAVTQKDIDPFATNSRAT